MRWVGGVRCLGLFPKKSRFFFTPSLSASEELFGLNIPDGISVEEVRAILSNVGTVLSMASEKLELLDKLVGESGSSAPTASPVTLASSSVRPPLKIKQQQKKRLQLSVKV